MHYSGTRHKAPWHLKTGGGYVCRTRPAHSRYGAESQPGTCRVVARRADSALWLRVRFLCARAAARAAAR